MEFYLLTGAIGILAIGLIFFYNALIQKRQMVENGWSDMDVQLKRRADLIPSLVAVVKGYAAHERTLLEDVVTRRNEALAAEDQTTLRAEKEAAVSRDVGRLIALAEAYPDLKANDQFLKLQEELSNTENEIAYARRFFNGAVREYNIAIETVPSNLIAGMFRFSPRMFFQADESDRDLPSVSSGSLT